MFEIIEINTNHNKVISHIIKTVGAEFGAVGEGYGPSDSEVAKMSNFYHQSDRAIYLVALLDDVVVGGCGIAIFDSDKNICELRKLFLLPKGRNLGIGRALVETSLEFARKFGYDKCYLDTLSNMDIAIKLYESLGFKHLSKSLDGTIHGACDVWMLLDL